MEKMVHVKSSNSYCLIPGKVIKISYWHLNLDFEPKDRMKQYELNNETVNQWV